MPYDPASSVPAFPNPSGPTAGLQQELVSGAFVRNAWYVAGWSEDLEAGKLIARTIMDEPIVFFRREDGTVAAIEDRCVHRFAPISMGKVMPAANGIGARVQCPYHGLEYDGNGQCVHNPHGNKAIPSRAKLKSYPVVEKHQAMWIWMGDKAADAALIPNFSVLDGVPEIHTTKRDGFPIRAHVQLIIDNLLDLSHTSYLHEGILGNQDTVESAITVEPDGDDVVVKRRSSGSEAPGMFAQFWPGHPPRVDKFTTMRWMAPSTLRLISGICEPGAPIETGTGYHAIHMLTPESQRSTHYFFTAVRFGVVTKDEKLNRELQVKIAKLRRFAFEEQDAPVIEAQQVRIESASVELDPVVLAIDVGVVRYKRVIEKMLKAEARA